MSPQWMYFEANSDENNEENDKINTENQKLYDETNRSRKWKNVPRYKLKKVEKLWETSENI